MGSVYVKGDGTSGVIWMKTKQNKTKQSDNYKALHDDAASINREADDHRALSFTLTRAKTNFIREDPYYDDREFHNTGTDNDSVNKDYLLMRVCVFVFACA